MADEPGKGTPAEQPKSAPLTRVERATAIVALAVVVWTFAIVLVTRLLDPPWIFIGQLLATGLILRYALRHEDGRYRRAGLAVVGGSMVGWGLTVIAAVHVVTPYAAVVTATGCALIGAVVWGVVSRRPLPEARSPG